MIGLLAVLISGTVFQAIAQAPSPSPTASPTKASSNKKKPSPPPKPSPTPAPASPTPTPAPTPAPASPTPAAASPRPTKSALKAYMKAHRKVASQTPAPAFQVPQLIVLPKDPNARYAIKLEAKGMVPNYKYKIGIWSPGHPEPFTLGWMLRTDSAGHGLFWVQTYPLCHPLEGADPVWRDFGRSSVISIGLFEMGPDYGQLGVGPLVQTSSPTCLD